MTQSTTGLVEQLSGGKCPDCKGWGEVAYFGELVTCKCLGKYEAPISMTTRRKAADFLSTQETTIAELQQKLRMVISHATGGGTDDISLSVNDISCRITQHRNTIYKAGGDKSATTIAELVAALEGFLAGADAGYVSVEVDKAARLALTKSRSAP